MSAALTSVQRHAYRTRLAAQCSTSTRATAEGLLWTSRPNLTSAGASLMDRSPLFIGLTVQPGRAVQPGRLRRPAALPFCSLMHLPGQQALAAQPVARCPPALPQPRQGGEASAGGMKRSHGQRRQMRAGAASTGQPRRRWSGVPGCMQPHVRCGWASWKAGAGRRSADSPARGTRALSHAPEALLRPCAQPGRASAAAGACRGGGWGGTGGRGRGCRRWRRGAQRRRATGRAARAARGRAPPA